MTRNSEAARQSRPARIKIDGSRLAPAAAFAKVVPELVIRLPIEGSARLRLFADSFEGERWLREWLKRAGVVAYLPLSVDELLGALDALDEAA